MKNKRFVVVTTDKDRRGVFAGFLEKQENGICILSEARMAVYWSKETRGVLGLASIGPQRGSRITPAVPQIELNGVTSVMNCNAKAQKLWESEPWD